MAREFANDFMNLFALGVKQQQQRRFQEAQLAQQSRELGLLDAFRTKQLAQQAEQFGVSSGLRAEELGLARTREGRITEQESQRLGLLGQQFEETKRKNLAQEALEAQGLGIRRASVDVQRLKAQQEIGKTPDVSTPFGKVQGSLRALQSQDLQGSDRDSELNFLRQESTTMIEKAKLGNEAELITELKGGVEGFQPVTKAQAIKIANQSRIGEGKPELTREQIRQLELFYDSLEAK